MLLDFIKDLLKWDEILSQFYQYLFKFYQNFEFVDDRVLEYTTILKYVFVVLKRDKISKEAFYALYKTTSLLGPIFYFNCEHCLFVYIGKQNKKSSQLLTKTFVDFQNFQKFNENQILMETSIWNFDHS